MLSEDYRYITKFWLLLNYNVVFNEVLAREEILHLHYVGKDNNRNPFCHYTQLEVFWNENVAYFLTFTSHYT